MKIPLLKFTYKVVSILITVEFIPQLVLVAASAGGLDGEGQRLQDRDWLAK